MAQLLNHAQPGDVITADDWNLVVDAINELLQAGQTSGIKIDNVVPAGSALDPFKIGSLVQVVGQNFGFSIGQSKVIFEAGGTSVTVLRAQMLGGSFDERLMFMMPPIPGITPAGLAMTMKVDNGVASDNRSVFVMPVVISLIGDIFVGFRADVNPNPSPNPVVSTQQADFAFRLQSGTNIPASYDLSADIINSSVAVPASLVSSIQFRENNATITSKKIDMGKSEIRDITVRIPQIPVTFIAGTSFTLKLTATSGSVTGTDQRSITVGTALPVPDPKIEVIQLQPQIFNVQTGNNEVDPANGRLEGSTIKLKTGRQMVIGFNVKLTQNGVYQVTIQPRQGTTLTGWGPALVDTQTTITVPTNNDQTTRLLQFGVTTSTVQTPSPTGTVIFKIKRDTATVEFNKEFGVELLP
ncbi:MAG TPA: hypothetical protein VFH96_01025 [Pyrinomonadaceae bacterium]|nr:hypothetical protein [Pyrinomonadaceae bacterium]